MKCECGAISTVLVENEDGTITPKCDQCYYNPQFGNENNNRQPQDSADNRDQCPVCGHTFNSNECLASHG